MAEEIVKYAQSKSVTKIIIGKTGEPRWRELTGSSIVSKVLHRSGDIDVYVIRGQKDPADESKAQHPVGGETNYLSFVKTIVVTAISTVLAKLISRAGLSETNQAMVFILQRSVRDRQIWTWPRYSRVVAGVLAFDFFLVPPYYSFRVTDTEYFITFAVMLTIAILITHWAFRVRRQVETLRQRQWRTEALYRLSRKAGCHRRRPSACGCRPRIIIGEFNQRGCDISAPMNRPAKSGSQPTQQFRRYGKEIAVAQWYMSISHSSARNGYAAGCSAYTCR